MPEFHLQIGTAEAAAVFNDLPAFTRGYIESMFFTNCSSPDDGELENATFADLATETLDQIKADCSTFEKTHALLLESAYEHGDYGPESAGRDFWYTRNGHGVGFWDRGLGEIGDTLADACRHTEISPYLGDDGKVYLQ